MRRWLIPHEFQYGGERHVLAPDGFQHHRLLINKVLLYQAESRDEGQDEALKWERTFVNPRHFVTNVG